MNFGNVFVSLPTWPIVVPPWQFVQLEFAVCASIGQQLRHRACEPPLRRRSARNQTRIQQHRSDPDSRLGVHTTGQPARGVAPCWYVSSACSERRSHSLGSRCWCSACAHRLPTGRWTGDGTVVYQSPEQYLAQARSIPTPRIGRLFVDALLRATIALAVASTRVAIARIGAALIKRTDVQM